MDTKFSLIDFGSDVWAHFHIDEPGLRRRARWFAGLACSRLPESIASLEVQRWYAVLKNLRNVQPGELL